MICEHVCIARFAMSIAPRASILLIASRNNEADRSAIGFVIRKDILLRPRHDVCGMPRGAPLRPKGMSLPRHGFKGQWVTALLLFVARRRVFTLAQSLPVLCMPLSCEHERDFRINPQSQRFSFPLVPVVPTLILSTVGGD